MNNGDNHPPIPPPMKMPWEIGKCAYWHKPCAEARDECNMYQDTTMTTQSPLGTTKQAKIKACLIFVIHSLVSNPIVISGQQQQPFKR